MATIFMQPTVTSSTALDLVHAAVDEGNARGIAVSVAVVDPGLNLVAFAKADGATAHSAETSRRKADTAASTRRATGWMGPELDPALALATGLALTNIRGGSPIRFEGTHVGGIGIAGGTPQQDAEVAEAALARIGADTSPTAA